MAGLDITESTFSSLIIHALQREDYFEWFKERGINISPMKSGNKPSAPRTIHNQPILGRFGRGDVFVSWGKKYITLIELKVTFLSSSDIGQIARYREYVRDLYPTAQLKSIVLCDNIVSSKINQFDGYILASYAGIEVYRCGLVEDGLHFYDSRDPNWIKENCTRDNLWDKEILSNERHYEPFRIQGKKEASTSYFKNLNN